MMEAQNDTTETGMSEAAFIRSATYLLVPDVSALGSYYGEVIGLQCDYSAGEPAEFAIYSRGGLAIMLRRTANVDLICPIEKQGGTWDVFTWVADVEALHRELAGRGADVIYTPVVQPYGIKEFAVRDPVGYVLGFGQQWPATGDSSS
jgi:hypothetical protein